MTRTHCEVCGKALLGSPQRIATATECDHCGVVFAKLAHRSPRASKGATRSKARPVSARKKIDLPAGSDQPSALRNFMNNHEENIRVWASDRSVWPRIPLLLYMTYLGIRYLINPEHHAIFDGINLAIHEAGHLLFSMFPRFLMILGGTLLQLAAPVICGIVFYRQPDYFGIGFCGCWLGANCYNVAIYQADAQERLLPLVTVGGGIPIHDWHYLLDHLGLLQWDNSVAFLTRCLGFCLIWGSVAYSAWVLRMIHHERREKSLL